MTERRTHWRSGAIELVTGHFQRGSEYRVQRPGGTDDHLLMVTRSGRGRVGDQVVGACEIALYEPHAPHDYGGCDGRPSWDFYWAHVRVRPAWREWLGWPEVEPGLRWLRVDDDGDWRAILRACADMDRAARGGGHRRAEAIAMNALERVLLLAAEHDPARTDGLDPRVRCALDHIAEHLADPLDLASLAAVCGTSSSRLSHLFTDQVGCGPMRHLERERLRRAAQLLALTDLPVAEVASEVGYADPFYFSTRFRREHATSPSDWRRQRGLGSA